MKKDERRHRHKKKLLSSQSYTIRLIIIFFRPGCEKRTPFRRQHFKQVKGGNVDEKGGELFFSVLYFIHTNERRLEPEEGLHEENRACDYQTLYRNAQIKNERLYFVYILYIGGAVIETNHLLGRLHSYYRKNHNGRKPTIQYFSKIKYNTYTLRINSDNTVNSPFPLRLEATPRNSFINLSNNKMYSNFKCRNQFFSQLQTTFVQSSETFFFFLFFFLSFFLLGKAYIRVHPTHFK